MARAAAAGVFFRPSDLPKNSSSTSANGVPLVSAAASSFCFMRGNFSVTSMLRSGSRPVRTASYKSDGRFRRTRSRWRERCARPNAVADQPLAGFLPLPPGLGRPISRGPALDLCRPLAVHPGDHQPELEPAHPKAVANGGEVQARGHEKKLVLVPLVVHDVLLHVDHGHLRRPGGRQHLPAEEHRVAEDHHRVRLPAGLEARTNSSWGGSPPGAATASLSRFLSGLRTATRARVVSVAKRTTALRRAVRSSGA